MNNSTHLRDIRWVSLDFETLGLAPSIDPIIEVGAVFFRRSGMTTRTFGTLCNPGLPVPNRIRELTGIDDAMLQGQPTPDDPIRRIADWLIAEPHIIVAHGVATDLAFLRENITRLGIELPPMIAVDTLPLSRLCIEGSPDYKLETLANSLPGGDGPWKAHRALDDALQTRNLFLHCLQNSPKPLDTIEDLEKARVLIREPKVPIHVRPIPERFETLVTWTREEKLIEFVYRAGSRKGEWRIVQPQTFFQRGGHHYLRGWCTTDRVGKDFRLDRIGAFRLSEDESSRDE